LADYERQRNEAALPPYVFTQQLAALQSSVLETDTTLDAKWQQTNRQSVPIGGMRLGYIHSTPRVRKR
jgi:hypothetical protein